MNGMTPATLLSIIQKNFSFHRAPQRPITGISVDSRTVRPGDLFFALPGMKTDGALFIDAAVKKGAVGIVTRDVPQYLSDQIALLVVPDVLASLQDMAKKVLQCINPTVIAITGSLGKTTTKEYTKRCLEVCGAVAATEGSCNSQIGLAMSTMNTLLHGEKTPQWFVAEMGMTEKGQIAKLSSIVEQHIAFVTTIASVHSQNFTSMEEIA